MIIDALRDARALLFPLDCAGCGAPDRGLCDDCAALLRPAVTPRSTPGGLVVYTALRYESEVRRIILTFKEEGRTDLARQLSWPLGEAIRAALAEYPDAVVVPVPSSRAGYRRRGFDPVRLLLRRTGRRFERVLAPTRATGVQKSLGRVERADNLRDALGARPGIRGRRVLLIDDILTTGATLEEAARAVAAAGGEVVGAATMAFTPRLHRSRDIPGAEDYGGV
ncbi:ComF family protein [Salinibacterium soli]|uniref:Phosphoribosyltransferase family protein n=1 Tax=Antiquaquibacter soli TaxID=3064523 RepID=A0ABT9BJH7_9MICO|nr:phosphoribosyltransferase family protein [Protaetiibacter sp. WY-16]MDO7881179.1 phosphoribosyltransferase family protein [Protaetiibacter sp. WY-16]